MASPDKYEVYQDKMSIINETLLPILLFVVYFILAIQFFPQHSTVLEQQVNPIVEMIPVKGSTKDLEAAVISRDWLETQSLANLKAIAAELCITPIGDKRSRFTLIDAIASTTPENTVLAVNLCYA